MKDDFRAWGERCGGDEAWGRGGGYKKPKGYRDRKGKGRPSRWIGGIREGTSGATIAGVGESVRSPERETRPCEKGKRGI